MDVFIEDNRLNVQQELLVLISHYLSNIDVSLHDLQKHNLVCQQQNLPKDYALQIFKRFYAYIQNDLGSNLAPLKTILKDPTTIFHSVNYVSDGERFRRSNFFLKSLHNRANAIPHYMQKQSFNPIKSLFGREIKGTLGFESGTDPYKTNNFTPQILSTENYGKNFLKYTCILGHLSSVYCVAFDRTGHYIITGADDHLVKVWGAWDGRLLATLRGHSAEITDLAIDAENVFLAASSVNKIIRVWSLTQNFSPVAVLTGHSAMITTLQFSPYCLTDKRYLISSGNDGNICIWVYDINQKSFNGTPIKFIERTRTGNQMLCTSFSQGGLFLAAGGSDHVTRIYYFGNDYPEKFQELKLHSDRVDSIKFSNHSLRFVTGSRDGLACIWTFDTNEHKWNPITLNMSTKLSSTTRNANNCGNSMTTAGSSKEFEKSNAKLRVTMVAWNSDDTLVITAMTDFRMKVWDSFDGTLLHELKAHTDDIFVLEYQPKYPALMVSASHDGFLILWDLIAGVAVSKIFNNIENQGHGAIFDAKFAPHGLLLASTDSHGQISIYGYGVNHSYENSPREQFFHTDFRPLVRNTETHEVTDEQTHLQPHLMPPPFLVDIDGNPYPPNVQRRVPGRHDSLTENLIPNVAPRENGELEIMDNIGSNEGNGGLQDNESPTDNLDTINSNEGGNLEITSINNTPRNPTNNATVLRSPNLTNNATTNLNHIIRTNQTYKNIDQSIIKFFVDKKRSATLLERDTFEGGRSKKSPSSASAAHHLQHQQGMLRSARLQYYYNKQHSRNATVLFPTTTSTTSQNTRSAVLGKAREPLVGTQFQPIKHAVHQVSLLGGYRRNHPGPSSSGSGIRRANKDQSILSDIEANSLIRTDPYSAGNSVQATQQTLHKSISDSERVKSDKLRKNNRSSRLSSPEQTLRSNPETSSINISSDVPARLTAATLVAVADNALLSDGDESTGSTIYSDWEMEQGLRNATFTQPSASSSSGGNTGIGSRGSKNSALSSSTSDSSNRIPHHRTQKHRNEIGFATASPRADGLINRHQGRSKRIISRSKRFGRKKQIVTLRHDRRSFKRRCRTSILNNNHGVGMKSSTSNNLTYHRKSRVSVRERIKNRAAQNSETGSITDTKTRKLRTFPSKMAPYSPIASVNSSPHRNNQKQRPITRRMTSTTANNETPNSHPTTSYHDEGDGMPAVEGTLSRSTRQREDLRIKLKRGHDTQESLIVLSTNKQKGYFYRKHDNISSEEEEAAIVESRNEPGSEPGREAQSKFQSKHHQDVVGSERQKRLRLPVQRFEPSSVNRETSKRGRHKQTRLFNHSLSRISSSSSSDSYRRLRLRHNKTFIRQQTKLPSKHSILFRKYYKEEEEGYGKVRSGNRGLLRNKSNSEIEEPNKSQHSYNTRNQRSNRKTLLYTEDGIMILDDNDEEDDDDVKSNVAASKDPFKSVKIRNQPSHNQNLTVAMTSPPPTTASKANASADSLSLADASLFSIPGWMTEYRAKKSPFVPQIGDEIVYFREGHKLYVEMVQSGGVYPLETKCLPYVRQPSLRPVEFARVTGLRFEIRPPRLCCVKLALMDPVSSCLTGGTFSFKYHDMPHAVDFMILKQTYRQSLAKTHLALSKHFDPFSESKPMSAAVTGAGASGDSSKKILGEGTRIKAYIDDIWWKGTVVSVLFHEENKENSRLSTLETNTKTTSILNQAPSLETESELETEPNKSTLTVESFNETADRSDENRDEDILGYHDIFLKYLVHWDKSGEIDKLSPWDMEFIDEENESDSPSSSTSLPPNSCNGHRSDLLNYRPLPEEWSCYGQDFDIERISEGLKSIMSLEVADAFIEPVDFVEYYDYLQLVPYPIDLTLIKSRLENYYYRRRNSLLYDVRLVLMNAKIYNHLNSPVVIQAQLIVELCNDVLYNDRSRPLSVYKNLVNTYKTKYGPNCLDFQETQHPDHVKQSTNGKIIDKNGFKNDLVPPNQFEEFKFKSNFVRNEMNSIVQKLRGTESSNQSNRNGVIFNEELIPHEQWIEKCHKILKELFEHPDSEPFRFPVDINDYPSYRIVIKEPIDLGTIRKNLSRGFYKSYKEFRQDVRLMFANSKAYNTNKRSLIYSMTLRLSSLFEARIKNFADEFLGSRHTPPKHISGSLTNQNQLSIETDVCPGGRYFRDPTLSSSEYLNDVRVSQDAALTYDMENVASTSNHVLPILDETFSSSLLEDNAGNESGVRVFNNSLRGRFKSLRTRAAENRRRIEPDNNPDTLFHQINHLDQLDHSIDGVTDEGDEDTTADFNHHNHDTNSIFDDMDSQPKTTVNFFDSQHTNKRRRNSLGDSSSDSDLIISAGSSCNNNTSTRESKRLNTSRNFIYGTSTTASTTTNSSSSSNHAINTNGSSESEHTLIERDDYNGDETNVTNASQDDDVLPMEPESSNEIEFSQSNDYHLTSTSHLTLDTLTSAQEGIVEENDLSSMSSDDIEGASTSRLHIKTTTEEEEEEQDGDDISKNGGFRGGITFSERSPRPPSNKPKIQRSTTAIAHCNSRESLSPGCNNKPDNAIMYQTRSASGNLPKSSQQYVVKNEILSTFSTNTSETSNNNSTENEEEEYNPKFGINKSSAPNSVTISRRRKTSKNKAKADTRSYGVPPSSRSCYGNDDWNIPTRGSRSSNRQQDLKSSNGDQAHPSRQPATRKSLRSNPKINYDSDYDYECNYM